MILVLIIKKTPDTGAYYHKQINKVIAKQTPTSLYATTTVYL